MLPNPEPVEKTTRQLQSFPQEEPVSLPQLDQEAPGLEPPAPAAEDGGDFGFVPETPTKARAAADDLRSAFEE